MSWLEESMKRVQEAMRQAELEAAQQAQTAQQLYLQQRQAEVQARLAQEQRQINELRTRLDALDPLALLTDVRDRFWKVGTIESAFSKDSATYFLGYVYEQSGVVDRFYHDTYEGADSYFEIYGILQKEARFTIGTRRIVDQAGYSLQFYVTAPVSATGAGGNVYNHFISLGTTPSLEDVQNAIGSLCLMEQAERAMPQDIIRVHKERIAYDKMQRGKRTVDGRRLWRDR